MTSKEKLKDIRYLINEFYSECTEDNQIKSKEVFMQYCDDIEQELTQQPTFSECIKEWEDRGWTISELKQFPVIKIWKFKKEQGVVDNIYVYPKKLNSTIDFYADYETLNLLAKTLKASEEKEK